MTETTNFSLFWVALCTDQHHLSYKWVGDTIAPFTLAIEPRFESGNCDKPASVVAGSFTLQGGRGGWTSVVKKIDTDR